MKKNKSVSKPKSKSTTPAKSAKTAKPAVVKANKSLKPAKKEMVVSKAKVAKATDKTQKVKASPVKEVQVKAKITAPAATSTKVEVKDNKVTKVAKDVGQARVIEPLSWDAEKPKLNLTLTNKITRKDLKDKEDAEVKSYTIKARYTVGDRVMHSDFGKGLVRDLIGDFKIRVAFRDFEKVLVHGINS